MMKPNAEKTAHAVDLRRRAEERLKNQQMASTGPLSEVETQRLLHELQVSQIELEMQNEELCASREELQQALARYTDLYNVASMGCLARAPNDVIGRSNLAAASFLDLLGAELLGQRIGEFMVAAVTESERLNGALRESEKRLNLAVAAADLGIFDHDHVAETIYWSPTLRRIFGWRDDEMASLAAYLELTHLEDRAVVVAAVQAAHDPAGNGQYRIEHRIMLRDGRVRWISALSRTSFDGIGSERHPVATIGTIADITDLKQTRETLRENQARLQLVVETSNIGVWDWNLLTNEVYLSPQWKCQLGYADDELPNRYEEWETRLHPDDRERTLKAVKDCLENKRPEEIEFRLRHKDSSWRWILSPRVIELSAHGQPVRMLGCHMDITARKKSEAALQASRNRLASLTRQLIVAQETERRHLARELHDEIGQVLSAISISLKTVHMKVDPSLWPPLQECVEIVDRAIQQIRDLALDLRPAMLDDFGLEAALRWYANRFAERTGLTVHFTAHLARPELPEMLRTVCFRLAQETMTNIQRHGKAQQVWLDLQQQEKEVTLTMRDDGQGFDVPRARALAAQGGSLGLISMQERVELVGGRLDIESRPGLGTLVRVWLPVLFLEDQADDGDKEAQP